MVTRVWIFAPSKRDWITLGAEKKTVSYMFVEYDLLLLLACGLQSSEKI